ncbi:MAG TPA: NUDIX domain-containing protein [Sphingomicrobium sp.]|nr:NUDIX domain-containing protein [Sphingomicrobium sp.]
MLQQTTVAAVIPRFERFLGRWPTFEALAAAPEEEVLGEWAGLGYYARARNLIACARRVASAGGFPDTEEALRELPGVGDYTAAAIAAIAFGRDAAAVDANVERVTARLHGLEATTKSELRSLVAAMLPKGRAGDFAQAMMDLGATICRARQPLCRDCPLSGCCSAFASGTPERFPARRARPPKPVRYGIAYWIEDRGSVWLVRRRATGLLGGMAALPGDEWTPESKPVQAIAAVRHVFTHFELRLSVVAARGPIGEGWWQPLDTIPSAGLPTLYRRAVGAAIAAGTERAAA